MKQICIWIVALLLTTGAVAQTQKKSTASKKSPAKVSSGGASVSSPALYQKWVRSYEDEKGQPGVKVYRPESYSFPPARGREAISFQKSGSLVRFDIGPSDGQKIIMGTWVKTKFSHTMKVTVQGAENEVYFLEVISVSKDMLKVKRKLEI